LKAAAKIPSEVETDLAENNEILRILADTASDFINLPIEEVEPAIQHALEDVAQRVGADRAYIFDYDFQELLFDNTFEWCAPGITPQIDNLRNIPFAGTESVIELHRRGEPFIEEDVPGMPQCTMRDMLLPQEIKSIITIPLANHLDCVGFIGFDFVRAHHRFRPRETNLLLFFSKMLSGIRMRRATLAELERTTQEIKVFFDTSVSLLCTASMDGRFHRVSKSWEDLLGIPVSQIEGSRFLDFVHPEDAEDSRQKFASLLEDIPLTGYVNRYRRADGSYRFIEWNTRLVNSLVYSVAQDVSRRMEEERALQASLQSERETAEIKGRLISMASHEFRTPLATIQMAAEMLEAYWPKMDRDAISRRLCLISATTTELTNIISDVLDLSILEAGNAVEAPQVVEIVSTSRQIAEELAENMGTGHQIHFTSQRDCANIPIKLRLYKLVLTNFVENAIKYSPPDCGISLSLGWDKTGNRLRIEVRDQGIGIPGKLREKIWDPFFRANNIGTVRGTGLGLAIAKQAVTAMGGRIGFKPAGKQGGSLFFFIIPTRSQPKQKSPKLP